jgi:hypothetical protein
MLWLVFVIEGIQEWPQGRTQLVLLAADEILSGTAEGQVKPVGPILSHMNPVHTLTSNLCEIHFNIIFPSRCIFF